MPSIHKARCGLHLQNLPTPHKTNNPSINTHKKWRLRHTWSRCHILTATGATQLRLRSMLETIRSAETLVHAAIPMPALWF